MSIPAFLKSKKQLAGHHLHLAVALGVTSGFLLIIQAWLLAKLINAVIFEKAPLAEVTIWLWPMLGTFSVSSWINVGFRDNCISGSGQYQTPDTP